MGREVREVSKDWEHPKDSNGMYIPIREYSSYECVKQDFEEDYIDEEPIESEFMPNWKPEELTHIQMYEDTSEGTPISPKFLKGEEEKMAQWLVDNQVSWFGRNTTNYETWLECIKNQYYVHKIGPFHCI